MPRGSGRPVPRSNGTGRRPANPRLLRQRLFVFVVVTLLVALGIAAAQGCQGPVRGLTFVANVEGERYAGRISDEVVADHIAHACGENGSCAEYLLETVLKCEELGIHDHFLWRLQELVAERMRAHTETR